MNYIIISLLAFICISTLGESYTCLKEYSGPKICVLMYEAQDIFGQELGDKYGMQLLMTGGRPLIDSKVESYSYSFASPEKMTLEQSRNLALKLFDEMWAKFTNEPAFLNEYERMAKSDRRNIPPKMTFDLVGFKVSFWDYDINRYQYPYLAQVKLVDQKIYYYYADPQTQALQEPTIETLDEARQKQKP